MIGKTKYNSIVHVSNNYCQTLTNPLVFMPIKNKNLEPVNLTECLLYKSSKEFYFSYLNITKSFQTSVYLPILFNSIFNLYLNGHFEDGVLRFMLIILSKSNNYFPALPRDNFRNYYSKIISNYFLSHGKIFIEKHDHHLYGFMKRTTSELLKLNLG